jgi:hypothetical protein
LTLISIESAEWDDGYFIYRAEVPSEAIGANAKVVIKIIFDPTTGNPKDVCQFLDDPEFRREMSAEK